MTVVKTIAYFSTCLALVILLFGCNKADQKRTGALRVQINHTVDGKPLTWDSLIYMNQAGNVYSVERLQYYLSDFKFYGNGELVAYIDIAVFIDARVAGKDMFTSDNFPFHYVDSVSFLIGVTPKYNVAGGLPPTMENAVMDWPAMMGGGYHFLKLEGRWADNTETNGFAMHLGKPGFQVQASARCAYLLRENSTNALLMTMNINQWFRDPHVYNFATDGVYSMGNEVLMQKLNENGRDVFLPN